MVYIISIDVDNIKRKAFDIKIIGFSVFILSIMDNNNTDYSRYEISIYSVFMIISQSIAFVFICRFVIKKIDGALGVA